MSLIQLWWGRWDLNPRPPAPRVHRSHGGMLWYPLGGRVHFSLDQARRLGMLDHLSNNRPLSLLGAWSAPCDSQGEGLLRGFPSRLIVSIEYLIQLGNLFQEEIPESQASLLIVATFPASSSNLA